LRFADDSMSGGLPARTSEPTTVVAMKRTGRASRGATIDFRMMRRAMIDSVRAGDVPLHDACDAHRDLVRAGRHYGRPRNTPCPMCATPSLRNVTYLFGPRLPKSGRCITSGDELRAVDRRPEHFAAYTVEVCVACKWHHLLTAAPRGGARPRKRRAVVQRVRDSTSQQVRRRA